MATHTVPLTTDELRLLVDALDGAERTARALGDYHRGPRTDLLTYLRATLGDVDPIVDSPEDWEDGETGLRPVDEDDDGQPDSRQEHRDFAGDDY